MTPTISKWDLPGPSAFIDDVLRDAQARGCAAVVMPKHGPDDLAGVLRERLDLFDLPIIDARSGQAPLQALSRAFEVELNSARALGSKAEAEGRAVLITGFDANSASTWETTLRAFLAGRSSRTQFGAIIVLGVMPEGHHATAEMGIVCHIWRNVIGFRDALLWALRERKVADPLLGRLAAEVAVSLAGWDLEEVWRQMQRLTNAKTVFERPVTAEIQNNPSWANGEIDEFDGLPFKRLASCGPEEVDRRIWRAQVTVLFGWLESVRNNFVAKNHKWLREGGNGEVIEPSEMEWSHLFHRARMTLAPSDPRRRLTEHARAMRNALAHGESIDFEMYRRLNQFLEQPRRS
ncbi:hypothetical protein [Rhodoblastus sp.]|uniref:hypothetical protein n=1 Tax=Rhodoblastus sp. TaxID=1962975 RepID=UPI003F9A8B0C